MRKLFVILTTSLLSLTCLAQEGFYIGYENGAVFERYNYVNSKAKTLTQASIAGIFGGYFGYKFNSYSVETGFYGLNSWYPYYEYNYSTYEASKTLTMADGQQSWLIPLRFGKEFLIAGDKIFIKPEIGFNIMVSRDFSQKQPMMGYGHNVEPFGGNVFIPIGSDSTRAYGYIPSKFNFSVEPGISSGYRFKKKADIYLKCSYIANFNQSYFETITHYSETETVYATRNVTNSILLQIGLKYYFAKRE